jgi:hypothetical protein
MRVTLHRKTEAAVSGAKVVAVTVGRHVEALSLRHSLPWQLAALVLSGSDNGAYVRTHPRASLNNEGGGGRE